MSHPDFGKTPLDYFEAVVCRRPITIRRRVLWSECDPAQIVYTVRFFDYAASAYGWFIRTVLNEGATTLPSAGLSLPMKALAMEFHSMLRPDDWFEMVLRLTDIRTRTFDLDVQARTFEGRRVFSAVLSPIVVHMATKRSVEIPHRLEQNWKPIERLNRFSNDE